MNKKVYCSELKGTQLYDDKLGVTGTFIFINSMIQYDMNKVKNSTELFLADKDYKQALNKIREYINNLRNFHIEAELEGKQKEKLYASEQNFVNDILQIINEAIGDDDSENK